ncbi:hypothetical protein TNCV_3515721 [Trichonephila clavipes]|nr:hypothetical protein TNCV_3515721 [Trichonephila clavipes]
MVGMTYHIERCSGLSPRIAPCWVNILMPRFVAYFSSRKGTSLERQCLASTIYAIGATPHIGRRVKAVLHASFGSNRDCLVIFRIHCLLAHPTGISVISGCRDF